ncbi:MAG: hypothetical protein CMI18_11995 [Opitutaceae bacterium]|nr:hypothetical protein [Opitutaceae bacterium]
MINSPPIDIKTLNRNKALDGRALEVTEILFMGVWLFESVNPLRQTKAGVHSKILRIKKRMERISISMVWRTTNKSKNISIQFTKNILGPIRPI